MTARTSKRQPLPFVPCSIEPREWQAHVNKLMSIEWALLGAAYQPVPDRINGDRGLEGFSTLGDGVQAYVDVESRTNAERRKGQMGKIRKDLKKLEKYAAWWSQTLQGLQLRTWKLIVPALDDANIVQYARKKGAELVSKALPFIAPDFQALVCTDQDFPRALALIQNPSLAYRTIPIRPIDDGAVSDFAIQTPSFTANIGRKITAYVRSPTSENLQAEQDQQLRNHLKCANYLDDMQVHFPTQWEQIEGTISSLADRIGTDNRASESTPNHRIKELHRDFGAALKHEVGDLPQDRQIMLESGLVARWLGDCTLEFTSHVTT